MFHLIGIPNGNDTSGHGDHHQGNQNYVNTDTQTDFPPYFQNLPIPCLLNLVDNKGLWQVRSSINLIWLFGVFQPER